MNAVVSPKSFTDAADRVGGCVALESLLEPHAVVSFAHNHPFFHGAVVRDQKLYGVYTGAHIDQPFLLNVGQIERIVWGLATRLGVERDTNHHLALDQYVLGLRRVSSADAAFSRGWVKPGMLFDCSDYEKAKLMPLIPAGKPSYLWGQNLRDFIGLRYPELDDTLGDLAVIRVDSYSGNGVDGCNYIRAQLGPDEKLEIYPGAEHRIGTNYWDDAAAIVARNTAAQKQMTAGRAQRRQRSVRYSSPQMR